MVQEGKFPLQHFVQKHFRYLPSSGELNRTNYYLRQDMQWMTYDLLWFKWDPSRWPQCTPVATWVMQGWETPLGPARSIVIQLDKHVDNLQPVAIHGCSSEHRTSQPCSYFLSVVISLIQNPSWLATLQGSWLATLQGSCFLGHFAIQGCSSAARPSKPCFYFLLEVPETSTMTELAGYLTRELQWPYRARESIYSLEFILRFLTQPCTSQLLY